MTASPERAPAESADVVRWEQTTPDDPRVLALRSAMDVEMAALYAGVLDARLVASMADPPGTRWLSTWLALSGEQPLATAALRWLGEGAGRLAEVKKVYVAPAGRRRGLAQQALRHVEASARERGVGELHLHTGDRQPAALALYAREGWRRVPVFAPYDALPISVCFAKTLG
ncbi:GNAT family N-acetyltransferase [Pseudokineococcus sp. 1T1Z-3]|uniref:GNAT family N-acetyltransferase n=1 Tax=Pseudokineococcus sp. 1T1Z-3 TaxID=3132745 RepID=UPI0030975923